MLNADNKRQVRTDESLRTEKLEDGREEATAALRREHAPHEIFFSRNNWKYWTVSRY